MRLAWRSLMRMIKTTIACCISVLGMAMALPLIKQGEGLSLEPYADPVGIMTVCFGDTHAIMRKYSLDECEVMLDNSMAIHGNDIARCIPVGLPDSVQGAALSVGYNMGATTFCKTRFAARLRAGDGIAACEEIPRLTTIKKGTVDCRIKANKCRGIAVRRDAEFAVCRGAH